MSGYDSLLGRREAEESIASIFEAEFPLVVGKSVKILERGESPDFLMSVAGVETGVELTGIKAADADSIREEIERLGTKKAASYEKRGLFTRPIVLLCHLDWPARDTEGPALFDIHRELAAGGPTNIPGFSEVWLMDETAKYTDRRDPRRPADFFCFSPKEMFGFYQRERKRVPYWSLVVDRFS
jgi:hypothetical protein